METCLLVCLSVSTHLFEFVADESERLVDGVRVSGDGDDSLGTGAIADVDFGTTLKKKGMQLMTERNKAQNVSIKNFIN